MAGGKDLTYKVGVDASDAVSGLKKLDSTVKSTMKNVESELDDGATAGDKFAASIDQLSAQLKTDFDKSATAAQELQRALKEAGSTLDVGEAVSELSRLGFTFDEITADADKFANSLKQLDDVRLDGVKQLDAVAPGLATKLNNVEKSADSSKSVLANMVGNATQDLGALGGVAGSAGVAIGQMGEYMADARAQGEGFGSILKNFAPIGGVIGGISIAMAGFSDIMSKMAKGQAATKAFDTAQLERFNAALEEGGDIAENYADSLEETGEVLVAAGNKAGPAWTKILPGVRDITGALSGMGKFGKEIQDILPLLTKAGVESKIWTEVITSDEPVAAMDTLRAALEQTNISDTERATILVAARGAQDDYNDSVTNGAEVTKFFGQENDILTDSWVESTAAALVSEDALTKNAEAADRAAKKARLLADKVAEFTNQYDIMTGRIDTDNAALDLADGFDAAADAAGKAYLLIMDKSPEAEGAIRDQERAFNDVKLKVINYHDELGRLPPSVITRINALVDQGDLANAEKQLNNVTRNREANIRIIAAGGAGYGPIAPGSGPRSVPATMSGIPTATQLARQIGTVRIPADIYVRSTPRITGIRE